MDIHQQLQEPLPKELTATRQGAQNKELTYLPGYQAINQANTLLGFAGWSSEVLNLTQVDNRVETKTKGDKSWEVVAVSYLAGVRVTAKIDGEVCTHEDVGFGNGTASNTAHGFGQSIELATKEAVTDGVKRCLRYLGDQFGLSLYDKESSQMTMAEIQETRMVSADELEKLRALYTDRGISDEWVLEALEAYGLRADSVTEMTFGQWQTAFTLANEYRRDEIRAAEARETLEEKRKIMRQASTLPMLKNLFRKVWVAAKSLEDKTLLRELQDEYNTLKEGFGEEGK